MRASASASSSGRRTCLPATCITRPGLPHVEAARLALGLMVLERGRGRWSGIGLAWLFYVRSPGIAGAAGDGARAALRSCRSTSFISTRFSRALLVAPLRGAGVAVELVRSQRRSTGLSTASARVPRGAEPRAGVVAQRAGAVVRAGDVGGRGGVCAGGAEDCAVTESMTIARSEFAVNGLESMRMMIVLLLSMLSMPLAAALLLLAVRGVRSPAARARWFALAAIGGDAAGVAGVGERVSAAAARAASVRGSSPVAAAIRACRTTGSRTRHAADESAGRCAAAIRVSTSGSTASAWR